MNNINTKEYWEKRFRFKEWNKNGRIQSKEYAKANVRAMEIGTNFKGSILDYGCALGDAIPVYSKFYPKAILLATDISESAIKTCKKVYGNFANFFYGDYKMLPFADVIIASHVMEHINNDRLIVSELLKKCNDLFIFVPYKEEPLYFEHVNRYDESYYNELGIFETKVFKVSYKTKFPLRLVLKNLFKLKFQLYRNVSKDIIMFHFRSKINDL